MEQEINLKQVRDAIWHQKEYCKRWDVPMFTPDDGICWSCHQNIYAGPKGITPEEAGTRLITSCPYCDRSYVE